MSVNRRPRLRTAVRVQPPFLLNQFPSDFGIKLGKEVIYLLATKNIPDISGSEWEKVFANCIGAQWKPTNVGLDDVLLGNCAWSAKTVYAVKPEMQKTVRLISGRNSPSYSYDQQNFDVDPQIIGDQVLEIWNGRVDSIRAKYPHLRTVVLIKSHDLTNLAVFEFDADFYPIEHYEWRKNAGGNLEGFNKSTKTHRFTWQPHGSQFTIIEPVSIDCLLVKIKQPTKVDKNEFLKNIEYDDSWITVTHRQG